MTCKICKNGWTDLHLTKFLVIFFLFILTGAGADEHDGVVAFSNTWAVELHPSEDESQGLKAAQDLIERHGFHYLGVISPNIYHIRSRRVAKRATRREPFHHRSLSRHPSVRWMEQQIIKRRVKRGAPYLNDADWSDMWYLNRGHGLDMNVKLAWENGYSGRGVVITILDDGIEKDHPDLAANYDPEASFDINGHDRDPQPRYDRTNENRHGTRCAGEVAAVANNSLCSVGIAYHSKIGGVRMLDGDVTDAIEAQSLSLNFQHIHIYSSSWGPDDNGKVVDGPARLARDALTKGVREGRNGKGSLFIWASGNGGAHQDSCAADGYTNSIYTIAVSSTSENGEVPWYSEPCASSIATTYSSGGGRERQVVTTDLRHRCTKFHTGTSASAPFAAGICALSLQANPALTWRDMQHIIIRTTRRANLKAEDWHRNGVGRLVSHHYGYGLMDASRMVQLALNWSQVPPQHECVRHANMQQPVTLTRRIVNKFRIASDGCKGKPGFIKYLEHVKVHVTLAAVNRGRVEMFIESPQGTKSQLAFTRPVDTSNKGYNNWGFMTIHSWEENPVGTWTLSVVSQTDATLMKWSLIQYGTSVFPQPIRDLTSGSREFKLTSSGIPVVSLPSAASGRVTRPASDFGAHLNLVHQSNAGLSSQIKKRHDLKESSLNRRDKVVDSQVLPMTADGVLLQGGPSGNNAGAGPTLCPGKILTDRSACIVCPNKKLYLLDGLDYKRCYESCPTFYYGTVDLIRPTATSFLSAAAASEPKSDHSSSSSIGGERSHLVVRLCKRCHKSCKKCVNSKPSGCLTCNDHYKFERTGSVCQLENSLTVSAVTDLMKKRPVVIIIVSAIALLTVLVTICVFIRFCPCCDGRMGKLKRLGRRDPLGRYHLVDTEGNNAASSTSGPTASPTNDRTAPTLNGGRVDGRLAAAASAGDESDVLSSQDEEDGMLVVDGTSGSINYNRYNKQAKF